MEYFWANELVDPLVDISPSVLYADSVAIARRVNEFYHWAESPVACKAIRSDSLSLRGLNVSDRFAAGLVWWGRAKEDYNRARKHRLSSSAIAAFDSILLDDAGKHQDTLFLMIVKLARTLALEESSQDKTRSLQKLEDEAAGLAPEISLMAAWQQFKIAKDNSSLRRTIAVRACKRYSSLSQYKSYRLMSPWGLPN
ncbi:hypothetical protein [Fimbriimonas ginsengisoli]|uniref:hypothetical protein n=1 Tax=Fimbriimonas ginsengisoli TaxID=1005039 RepID=UPI0011856606|nr:hypothetical protein [Fimbriimonas ginsengisoli]